MPRYDFDVIRCVNSDNLLFAEKESDSACTFYQVTNLKLLNEFSGKPNDLICAYKNKSKVNGVNVFAELNSSYSMVSFTIDLTCENSNDVEKYKSKYQDKSNNRWKYLACEDIFIQESAIDIAENVLKQEPHYYD